MGAGWIGVVIIIIVTIVVAVVIIGREIIGQFGLEGTQLQDELGVADEEMKGNFLGKWWAECLSKARN